MRTELPSVPRRVRIAWLIGLAVGAALAVSACEAGPGEAGPASSTTTTTTTAPAPGPDRPVVGTTFVDVPTADPPASGIIGLAGGTVQGATADGLTYSLMVPPGALGDPIDITIQPLERGGPPFGGDALFAFDLQPRGLAFTEPAVLYVTRPEAVLGDVVGIGSFDDDGQAFHRASTRFENTVAVEIRHFSTARATEATGGEVAEWSAELARSFTPSTVLTQEGHRYAEAVRAENAALAAQADRTGNPIDEATLAANLQSWLDDRIEGQLMAVGGRDRLVQALVELDQVSVDLQELPTGDVRDALSLEWATTDGQLREAWQALFETYLAPDCSAPLLDASDAILHPSHISSIARTRGWSGFALPVDDQGWCLRIRIEALDVPASVPDEEASSSTATVPVTMRYAMRTPRPPAFVGEPLESRFDNGFLRLAEREDEARACLSVKDASGIIPDPDGDTEACIELGHAEDTATFQVDPSGLDDLQIEARVELESLRDLLGAPTRAATALRRQRTLTLLTPSTVLPSPPSVTPVCARVDEVTDAGNGPAAGVMVTLTMSADAGSSASFAEVTGPTDADGRLCADYAYSELARPRPGSTVVFDVVSATWTDHLDRARLTNLVLEPDWIDLRLWNTADGRSFTDRIGSAAPSAFAFTDSRSSSWQAAVVRRAASPEQPDRLGARAVTPDAGTSGRPEDGGGIVVGSSSSALAVGGLDTSPVGIDLLGTDQPTPGFEVCVCRDRATAPGDGQLRFSATFAGRSLSHVLDVSWPQSVTSPPPPPPPPTPDPDGVIRTTSYAPERSFDPGTFRYDGGIQNVTRRTDDGVLVFEQTIEVDGVAVFCPRTDIVGSVETSCGSFSGSVNDVTWTISAGTSVITYTGTPRSFVVRLTIGSLDIDGVWVEQVYEITVVPGDDPAAGGGSGGGGGGGELPDACRARQDWVHDRRVIDPGGGGQ